MSVADGTIVQAKISYTLPASSICQNIYHFRVDAASPAAEAFVINGVDLALTDFWNNVEAYIDTEINSPEVNVDSMQFNAVTGRWETLYHIGDFFASDIIGVGATDSLAPAVAGMVQMVPIYRKHSGYKYIGGFQEQGSDPDGTPSSLVIAALLAMATDMKDNTYVVEAGVSTLQYVILDRSGPYHYEPVVGVIRNSWSYQRRRKFLKGV